VKRLAAIAGACVLAVAILMAGPSAPSGSAGDSVSVDALFYNAAGLVGGEDVKVAGVAAGTVQSVELTDQRLALVRMQVDSPFAPFRADARCEIRSQSLIGERFIQCDPGTPAAGALSTPAGSDTPTVPADRNSAPIDLDLLFDTFRAPYRERLAIILNELGAGLSGRGEDLNAIIRDANPALAHAREVLATLNGQKADLQRGIDDTDRTLAAVAADPASLDRFIGKLGAVSERFGRHHGALGESVARLPGLLGQAEPALRQLDGLSVEALPVLRNLRRTAPAATELAADVGPLAHSARPTLRRLGETAVTGRTALVRSLPFAESLKRTLVGLRPITPTLRKLLSSLVERGGTEGLVRFFYNSALATSRFDGTSHIFPAHLIGGICGLYRANEPPVEGCHGRFTSAANFAAAKRGAKGTGIAGAAPSPGEAPAGGGTVGAPPRLPSLPSLPALPTPAAPQPSNPGSGSVNGILDFLLGP
jgi:phospholipid/cholesterol/gamma-HCH transport system substrate-binding protein